MRALNYIVGNTFRLLRRQWFLSILTLVTAAAMFWLLGVIALTAINIQNMMDKIESELVVQVYLKKGVPADLVADKIKSLSWVSGIKPVSPQDALAKLEERLGQQARATRLLGENPLPWSIEVGVKNVEDVELLVKNLSAIPEVEDIVYAGNFIKRLGRVSSLVNRGVIAMCVLALFVTSLVVFNTIRISLFSQRDEIAIMSLVGATHGYIAFPFILQGILLAGAGSFLAAFGLVFLYDSGVRMLREGLPFVPMVVESSTLLIFHAVLIASGVALGWICSYISVSRYISVAGKPL